MGQWFGYIANNPDTYSGTVSNWNKSGNYPCPIDGQITKVRVRFTAGCTFILIVMRLVSGNTYHCVGMSQQITTPAGDYTYDVIPPISGVKINDEIGIRMVSTGIYECRGVSGKTLMRSTSAPTVCSNLTGSAISGFVPVIAAYVEEVVAWGGSALPQLEMAKAILGL